MKKVLETTTADLPEDVQAAFELAKPLPGGTAFQCGGAWGWVDFSTISLDRAERLVASGFPHLRRIERAADAEIDELLDAARAEKADEDLQSAIAEASTEIRTKLKKADRSLQFPITDD